MKVFNIADLYCGAGGTSTAAIEATYACGFQPKLTAVNHWKVAVNTHAVNHPEAVHVCANVDDTNPLSLFRAGELDALIASPECVFHSVARTAGKPINDQRRASAWCIPRWAEALSPPIILIENVPEFQKWGPLDRRNRPIKSKAGEIFRAWLGSLRALGYRIEWRVLCCASYGDPTSRKRLFIEAVKGRRRCVWPGATHGPGCDAPWNTARGIIDFSIEGRWLDEMPGKKRYEGLPLSPKTIERISDCGDQGGIDEPLDAVTTKDRHALISPLVEINGTLLRVRYRYRLLQPHELAGAQGFRPDYQFTGNKADRVKQIGNAVPRRTARALVAALITQNPDVRWLDA